MTEQEIIEMGTELEVEGKKQIRQAKSRTEAAILTCVLATTTVMMELKRTNNLLREIRDGIDSLSNNELTHGD